jgi:hypothetical protein
MQPAGGTVTLAALVAGLSVPALVAGLSVPALVAGLTIAACGGNRPSHAASIEGGGA